ncbi:MAG: DMT family transporter [Ilumatobacteraceae bacterium]
MTEALRPAAPARSAASTRRLGQVLIAAASVAWSLAGVMQRGLSDGVTTATQIGGRAGVAFIALSFLARRETSRSGTPLLRSIDRGGLAVALCMGAGSASFVFALNRTSVANVLFLQALAPFIAVVLGWAFLKEIPSRRTGVATVIAVAGVGLMVGGPSRGSLIGLGAAGLMTFLFALTIVITRHRRDISMAPAVALAMLLVFVCAAPFASWGDITATDWLLLVLMGTAQMGIGQACFVHGARLIPAAEVALLTLLEVVLGPLWVALAFAEYPGSLTLVGGAVVLAAVVYQATEATAADEPPPLVSEHSA